MSKKNTEVHHVFVAVRSCQQELADSRSGDALLDGIVRISSCRQRGVGAQPAQGGLPTRQIDHKVHPRRTVAWVGRFPPSSLPFPAWTVSVSSIQCTSHVQGEWMLKFSFPLVQKVASVPLPMWPPNRLVWPSSCSVRVSTNVFVKDLDLAVFQRLGW